MRIPFPRVVDSSMINDWRSCHQKFFLAYGEHWKPQGLSIHLHAGTCFAKGLERARLSFYEAGFEPDVAIGHGMRAIVEAWGSYEAPEGESKTLDRMCGALEFYFAQWPFIDTPGAVRGAHPKIMASGKRGIEFSFADPLDFLHPISGEPVIYSGRTDMIADFAGGTYLEDDKTTSKLGDSWAEQWDLRSQFTGYCWAARNAGVVVDGVLVRGVSILKTKYGAAQAITYRQPWEIDRWYGQLLRDLRDMQRSWEEGYWDYDLGEACNHYGGCQFKSVCKSKEPTPWLEQYFERRIWDPLERTETPVSEEAWAAMVEAQ